jgi:hypothetical protein
MFGYADVVVIHVNILPPFPATEGTLWLDTAWNILKMRSDGHWVRIVTEVTKAVLRPTLPPSKALPGDLHFEGDQAWIYTIDNRTIRDSAAGRDITVTTSWHPYEPTDTERESWLVSVQIEQANAQPQFAEAFRRAIMRAMPSTWTVGVTWSWALMGYTVEAWSVGDTASQFIPDEIFLEVTNDISTVEKFIKQLVDAFVVRRPVRLATNDGWLEVNSTSSNNWQRAHRTNPLKFEAYENRQRERLVRQEVEAVESILDAYRNLDSSDRLALAERVTQRLDHFGLELTDPAFGDSKNDADLSEGEFF